MENKRFAKVATAQCTVEKDVRANGKNIRRLIHSAKETGADLVHFCEGALSGYVKHQITDFSEFSWEALEEELKLIAGLCEELKIWAVLGSCHKSSHFEHPKNSLYVIDSDGIVRHRYDKRFCSHSEINDWFSSGKDAVSFEVNGIRFGCAICIEIQFPEVFLEYEKQNVDCVLFSSYSETAMFGIQAQGHAACNNYWLSMSVPTNKSEKLPANFISPNGKVLQKCEPAHDSIIVNEIDPENDLWEIPLKRARPWRREARKGDIYRASVTHQQNS